MITVPSKRFYVYTLCHPDGTPFYVGKGTSSRLFHHIQEAFRNTCDCRKCGVIRQIWASGEDVQHNIVSEFDDEDETYAAESALITEIGRGNLVNLTEGWKIPVRRPPPDYAVKEYKKKGKGSVRQRTDGRWEASLAFTKNGKLYRKSAYGKSKEEAQELIRSLQKLRDAALASDA